MPASGESVPPLSDDAAAALQRVQDDGSRLHLADLDPAALPALGLPPLPGLPAATPDDVAETTERLVAEGLAGPDAWALGPVRPAGPLATYAGLLVRPGGHVGSVLTWDEPAQAPAQDVDTTRVTVLIDAFGGGLACVERLAADSAFVSVDVLRLDVLVSDVTARAFTPPRPDASRLTLVLFADGRGTQVPSRLRVGADGTGDLESSRHGVLGSRTRHDRIDADGFADHLRLRLMAAG